MVLCLCPASAQQAITTPIFTSVTSDQNFRDLAGIAASMGGSGFVNPTSHGGVMRTGVFYRSEALSTGSLSPADLATLKTLHIGLDIDLRTPGEINGTPNVLAPNNGPDQSIGATYLNINIYGTANTPSSATVTSPALAIAHFEASYREFVTDPVQRANFRTVLLEFANAPGSVLYHCAAGKDRTGWTSMLLQTIAGVSPQIIQQDYLATNTYMAGTIAYALSVIKVAMGDAAAAIAAPALGVDARFLEAGFEQVAASYGSMDAYLKQGLGLSQADIYVLRAKMVTYSQLPGQSGFSGNAAAGATFLNALQNSPLSGAYTDYNYYLQSAIDAGTLGGVETQAGGQIHAETASYLLRQPQWLEGAIAPYANGRDLSAGETGVWLAGSGGYFWSDGHDGDANSSERSAGSVIGATHRIDGRASVYGAVGYNWGSVKSAGASADIGTALATIGGRYGFSTLDAGPYVAAAANVGRVDTHSKRALGGGLGTAEGRTDGYVYGGRVDIGDVIRLAPFTVIPQIGLRTTEITLGSFTESGSELALAINGINHTSSSVVADLHISLDPQKAGDWILTPSVLLGYERALGNPQVESSASLYGISVSQHSAFDSRYLVKAGLAFTAEHEAWTVRAGVNGVRGDASTGVNVQLSVGYRI
jgi:protein tyrosine/serine phosphatase